ncbi:extracellular exo-polygalacturonase [Colletotrichum truncatum]|uniref:Extracellular exo-polygalacturonase n=1 Tax=Colletotrichum truncatum TaxID=5467 RepID=A0ACC3ZLM3_COLTU|nr:extracellular exo-polygalacturonase [Colletotrichum truncatum]KAF6783989.1 extracellular exo-polygalacturonase [Colletotrichum truncatum]
MAYSAMKSLALVFLGLSITVLAGSVQVSTVDGRPQCTVTANGDKKSDVENILAAFDKCGKSGNIVFPKDQNYWIDQKLNPRVNDVRIQWRGEWTFSDNLTYWRSNSYFIEFQNHRAGFILSGDGIYIDGFGTGGIHGNGDAWYTAEAGETIEGRPMPFVFWNVSDVTVKNFYIRQPQFWAYNIMNGTNMYFENISSNATATKAPARYNWVQNTDGFDTMDARNIRVKGFEYTGGDDCVAIKPRSYNIHLEDVTCHGGNGIAIGSLGQYLEDSSVEDVVMNNLLLKRTSIDMRFGVYIKTWIGELAPQSHYENAGQPRGRGWGRVRNILFSNVHYERVNNAPSIHQNNGNNGSFAGTSNMEVSHVTFANFTGTLSGTSNRVSLTCSQRHPCGNITFKDINLLTSSGTNTTCTGRWTVPETVTGLSGC